ncbi:MAG: phosphate ABC transporter substrate-binding protein [Saprospiraceae bacterium]|nr:phosphate ABC transporter substrate-binding protein [Saprospiraceae bacterium]
MKANYILMLAVAALAACGPTDHKNGNDTQGASSSIKVTGSTTVGPLITKAAEAFEKANDAIKITISEGGSGVGIANLIDETTDLAMSSRPMKESEKEKMREKNHIVTETIVALDALAIVVHPGNPVKELSKEQLNKIFKGEIKNFSEVGGPNLEIVPVSRESSSGTFEFFKETVLEESEVAANALSQSSNGGVEQTISQTPGAIGYIGLGFMSERVKPVNVSWEAGEVSVPTMENAKAGAYPLTRPLYLYNTEKTAATVKPFLDFLMSAEGQQYAIEAGFIPVK